MDRNGRIYFGTENGKLICLENEGTEAWTFNTVSAQTVGPYQTFVFSDKFVLRATDQLVFSCQAGANVDVSFNFIDQNWI